MELKEIMQQQNFVVVGDTLKEEKYAFKIKNGLLNADYTVYCVGKELQSINDVEGAIDIIDLCINPVKGLQLVKELEKPFQCIVIQPGAESDELLEYLKSRNMPYIEGCLLVGLSLYGKND
jgi:predicted CoA-binding protein